MITRIKCLVICVTLLNLNAFSQFPIDSKATVKTKLLLQNIKRISKKGIMFGHQDDDAYGVGWREEVGRSDIKSITGSYPAVHGWDVSQLYNPHNLDTVYFDKMVGWIKDTYKRGGITTISWHLDNPHSKGNSWDKTPAVKHILPGGESHQDYLIKLDQLADFFKKCKVGFTKIPIIFRPYHEHNGDWFWWGKGNCTEEEYIQLWKFTSDYLRDEKGIHQLLYAFSPDRSRLNLEDGKSSYLYGYPGDDYVDIVGYDNYWDVGHPANKKTIEEQGKDLAKGLQLITAVAQEKNKVATLSETGQESLLNDKWFTEVLLNPIKNSQKPIEIAWILVWRNANTKHHYAPYPGHKSEPDFKEFVNDDLSFMESDLDNPYKKDKALK